MVTQWDAMQAKYGDNDYKYWQDAYAYRRLTGGTHAAALLFATQRLTPTLNSPPDGFECPFGVDAPSREQVESWLAAQEQDPKQEASEVPK